MTGIVSTISFRRAFGAIACFTLGRPRAHISSRISINANVVQSLRTAQREDLGDENPPIAPTPKFDGFEQDVWIVKQSPEALQYYLVRGIEP